MKALACFVAASCAMLANAISQEKDSITYLFTFGNSYTSTGFNLSGVQPSVTNPMGNPALGEGTSSGSINWVGYLTTAFNTSLVLNYDLAVSGACINNSIVSAVPGDLVSQVESDFRSHCASKPTFWTSDNAVFTFWIGINDIGNSYQTADPNVTVPALFDSYFSLVETLYETGARQFLFLNVPPTTRAPMIQAQNDTEAHARFVRFYNRELKSRIDGFSQLHPGVATVEYDAWSFMTKVLDYPILYGFKDATCQGDGCVWWNDYHPTSAFHELMVQDMVSHLTAFDSW